MSSRTVLVTFSDHNHDDIMFSVDMSVPQSDVDILSSFLQDSVGGGGRYNDGDTIQFGSMILRVAASDCLLTLQEPNLRALPLCWTDGVTNSIRLLRLQRDIADSVGLAGELDAPSIRSSVLVGVDWNQASGAFVLDRAEPEGLDSGWFVGRLATDTDYNNPNNLHRISVYEAMIDAPHIAGFLGLPPGCRVEVSDRSMQVFRNGLPLRVKEGSFADIARMAPPRD